MTGKLVLVVGPTGSGKGTLLAYAKEQMPEMIFPVSCTTRTPRPGEVNGQTYYFVSTEEFNHRIEAGEFLEYATYSGNQYGTLKSEILPRIAEGKLVVREVEVQGARLIQKAIDPRLLRIIYIDAGSWDDLERRIKARAPIGEPELEARRKRYEDETTFKAQASMVISNKDGELETAKQALLEALHAIARE